MVHVYSIEGEKDQNSVGVVLDIRVENGQIKDVTGNYEIQIVDNIPIVYDGTYGDCMDMRAGCIRLDSFKPWWEDRWNNRKPCTVEWFHKTLSGSNNSVCWGCTNNGSNDNPGSVGWFVGGTYLSAVSRSTGERNNCIYQHSVNNWEFVMYCIEGDGRVILGKENTYRNNFDFRGTFNIMSGTISNQPLRIGGRIEEFNSPIRPAGIRWPVYLHHVRVYDYALTKTRNNT